MLEELNIMELEERFEPVAASEAECFMQDPTGTFFDPYPGGSGTVHF